MIDAHPATLSWLASVRRQRVIPLGVDRFGQSGDLPDLYREYHLNVGRDRRPRRPASPCRPLCDTLLANPALAFLPRYGRPDSERNDCGDRLRCLQMPKAESPTRIRPPARPRRLPHAHADRAAVGRRAAAGPRPGRPPANRRLGRRRGDGAGVRGRHERRDTTHAEDPGGRIRHLLDETERQAPRQGGIRRPLVGLRARRRPAARRRQIREHQLGTVDRQGVPHRQLEPVAEHHDRRGRGRRPGERDVHLHPRALGSRRVLSPGAPRHRRPDGARHRRRRAECPEAGAVDRRRARGGRRHGAVHGDPGHRERKPGGGPLPHEQRHGAGGIGLRRGRRHAEDPRGDEDRIHRGAGPRRTTTTKRTRPSRSG